MRNLICRLFLIIVTAVIFFVVGEFVYSDFMIVFLLLIGLVLNCKTTDNIFDTISNYFCIKVRVKLLLRLLVNKFLREKASS